MRWPVLLAGATLLVAGAARLLTMAPTSQAAAGALVGAGLTIVAAWIWSELSKVDRDG